MSLRFGCIADDLTGGTDLALALSRGGARVVQIFGNPAGALLPTDVDAVVISLKIRTAHREEAVSEALNAAKQLREWGASQIYFKYCSTFDSTENGNIGPIAEALCRFTSSERTPFVPTFPANGRTVYQGHLFVFDALLSRSSMSSHPLTPMQESDLRLVLATQAPTTRVGLIPLQVVEAGHDAIRSELERQNSEKKRFFIVDALNEGHLDQIAAACASLPLLTGGSAFGESLAAFVYGRDRADQYTTQSAAPCAGGLVAILSGSCSAASQAQVERAASLMQVHKLSADMTDEPELHAEQVARAALKAEGPAVLISSTDGPDRVAAAQERYGRNTVGSSFERLQGEIAKALYRGGVRTFIVAGGETSGAVAGALGLKVMSVGDEIACGVPWMFDREDKGVSIAFKSGNFGGPDFYAKALETLR